MKSRVVPFTTVIVAAAICITVAVAQDKAADKKSDKAGAPSEEEMMKKWEAASTPGPAHKLLDSLSGNWDVAIKWWMAPDAPPMESKGTSKRTWIMGGRFLQDDHSGEFMGQPMKGLGLSGYDNLKKKYNSFWIDEGGTAMFTSEGTVSTDGKTFTYHGKMDDPMTGEKNKTIKFIVRIVSKDKHVFEMHEPDRGAKSLVGEMTYTRK